MRFKTTEKIAGEIVLGGLNLVLKRGVFFDLTKDKIGHHELVWAIHHGYVEAVDQDAQNAASAEKKVYTNKSRKIIVSQFLKRPLNSGDSIVLLKDDPTCVELDNLVISGLLVCEGVASESAPAAAKPASSEQVKKSTESRKSFKKKPAAKKEDKKDNSSESSKITSDVQSTPLVSEKKTIFVGSNNEELDL